MSDEEFSLETDLDSVSISKKDRLKHKCTHPGCGKFFSRPSRLKIHARTHTGERPFKCSFCDNDYARSEHLKRHVAVSHTDSHSKKYSERLPCESCNETFANKYSLAKHTKKFHLGKSYVCDICSKAFTKHNLLLVHRSEHFSKHPYSCEKCGKTFRFPNKLRLHQKTHDKTYDCTLCEAKDFTTWTELLKHKKLVHKANENKEFKCKECLKTFSSQKVLDTHTVTHGSDRLVYHCPVEDCPRFYCFERNLQQHIRTYHDEMRIKCSICPKTFVTNAKLKYHTERFHSGKDFPKKISSEIRAKRKDAGIKKKPMAELLSGFEDVDPVFQKEVLLHNKTVNLDIDTVRSELADKPSLLEDNNDSNEEEFPLDSVQVCKRKFNINQTKSSIIKYIT